MRQISVRTAGSEGRGVSGVLRRSRPSGLFGWGVIVFIVLVFSLPPSAAQTVKQPNIIMIIADDLGWRDAGYHGSEIRTPHLDQLAHDGLRLERHYVYPTCSPARAGLLTGRGAPANSWCHTFEGGSIRFESSARSGLCPFPIGGSAGQETCFLGGKTGECRILDQTEIRNARGRHSHSLAYQP